MTSLNNVVLIGNLTRDPELRYTSQGKAVASFGLAVDDVFRGKDGEIHEAPCFIEVESWGKTAESCNEYLKKGSLIAIIGKIRFESWEARDGSKRSRLKIIAFKGYFLSGMRHQEQYEAGAETNPDAGAKEKGSDMPPF